MDRDQRIEELQEFLDKCDEGNNKRSRNSWGLDRIITYKGKNITFLICNKNIEKLHIWFAEKGNHGGASVGEFDVSKDNFKEELLDVFEKLAQDKCRCNYCGAWVSVKQASFFAPAGVSCDKEECVKAGQADQDDFFSMPLD